MFKPEKLFLTYLSWREKLLFYLTIAIIAFSLIFNFLIIPLGKKWSQLNREILAKEMKLRKNIKFLKQERAVKKIYLKYYDYSKREGSDEGEMTSLLDRVEKVASMAGIHIANIRPRPIKNFSFYKKYTLEMNCEATLLQFIEFIYNLQKTPRLIRVERLKITSQEKKSLLRAQMFISKLLWND